jgi:hypothetical protein
MVTLYRKPRCDMRVGISSVLALLLFAAVAGAKEEAMSKDARLLLIRNLYHEIAVSKVYLPRGKRGVRVNAQGHLDQEKANDELKLHGAAVNPGTPVEITKIQFKSNELIFELNYGGRKTKKWYQHIEVGMGGTTQPIAPDNQEPMEVPYGSTITIRFDGKVPDLSSDQVKKILSSVLDFSRHSPTVVYSPDLPPKMKEAIKKHQVLVGMNRDAVLSSKGAPDRKVREDKDGEEIEDWIYGLPPHVLFVTFNGDTVASIKQY